MFRATPSTPPILVAAFGAKVFGIEMSSGKRLWRTPLELAVVLRVLVDGDIVLVLGSNLACLELGSGRVLWKSELPSGLTSGTLLVHETFVFVGGAGEVAAFDKSTGRFLWHDGFKGEGLGGVALATPGTAAQYDRSG